MYSLTAILDTRLDDVFDPAIPSRLRVITAGEVLTCSDDEYLLLERNGLIQGTTLAGSYGVPACWSAVYQGGGGGGVGGAVNSVTAGDASLTITPTTGDVVAKAKVSADTGNALTLKTDGLFVSSSGSNIDFDDITIVTQSGITSVGYDGTTLTKRTNTGETSEKLGVKIGAKSAIEIATDGVDVKVDGTTITKDSTTGTLSVKIGSGMHDFVCKDIALSTAGIGEQVVTQKAYLVPSDIAPVLEDIVVSFDLTRYAEITDISGDDVTLTVIAVGNSGGGGGGEKNLLSHLSENTKVVSATGDISLHCNLYLTGKALNEATYNAYLCGWKFKSVTDHATVLTVVDDVPKNGPGVDTVDGTLVFVGDHIFTQTEYEQYEGYVWVVMDKAATIGSVIGNTEYVGAFIAATNHDFSDAPADGLTYGRCNNEWARVDSLMVDRIDPYELSTAISSDNFIRDFRFVSVNTNITYSQNKVWRVVDFLDKPQSKGGVVIGYLGIETRQTTARIAMYDDQDNLYKMIAEKEYDNTYAHLSATGEISEGAWQAYGKVGDYFVGAPNEVFVVQGVDYGFDAAYTQMIDEMIHGGIVQPDVPASLLALYDRSCKVTSCDNVMLSGVFRHIFQSGLINPLEDVDIDVNYNDNGVDYHINFRASLDASLKDINNIQGFILNENISESIPTPERSASGNLSFICDPEKGCLVEFSMDGTQLVRFDPTGSMQYSFIVKTLGTGTEFVLAGVK